MQFVTSVFCQSISWLSLSVYALYNSITGKIVQFLVDSFNVETRIQSLDVI